MFYLRSSVLLMCSFLCLFFTSCQLQDEPNLQKEKVEYEKLKQDFQLQPATGKIDTKNALHFATAEEARKFLETLEKSMGTVKGARVDNSSVQDQLKTLDNTTASTSGFLSPYPILTPPKNGIFKIVYDLPPHPYLWLNIEFLYNDGKITDVKVSLGGISIGLNAELSTWTQLRYYPSTNLYVVEFNVLQSGGLIIGEHELADVYKYLVSYTFSFNPQTKTYTLLDKHVVESGKPIQPTGGSGYLPKPVDGGGNGSSPIWLPPITTTPVGGGGGPAILPKATPVTPEDLGPPVITRPIKPKLLY